MVYAYCHPDLAKDRHTLKAVIDSVCHRVPKALTEVISLGRTLKRRAGDILAYFDRPGTSNGPTEAITAAWNTHADQPSASGA